MDKKKRVSADKPQLNLAVDTPTGLITGAIKAVPAVKYALGIGGIAAVVAIVAGFKISIPVAVFGVIIMLGLMFVLLIFSKFSDSAPDAFKPLSLVLAWTFVVLTTAVASLLVTSFFWNWPRALDRYITSNSPDATGPTRPTPSPTTETKPVTEASILAEPKIQRAFWIDYPHEPDPGRRYWFQTDNFTWIEQYPKGQATKFRVIGRENVKGTDGTLLLEVQGNPAHTKIESDGSFEVFIPDKGSLGTDALFRHFIQGQWRAWRTLGEMNVIK